MKKSHVLLPLVMALGLTACSSNSNTESTGAEVVDGSTPAWQAGDIQPTSMPSSMNQPVSQPNYNTGNYSQPVTAQPAYTPTASSYGSSESVGNCNVVRDENDKPIYAQIAKGCYTDSTYTVGKKDTLFLIGYLTGTSASHIANLNGLNPNAKLPVGQSLRVR